MEVILFLRLISIFIAVTFPILIIVVVVYVIKLMKQRNEYLKEIRDEIKNKKNDSN